MKVGNVWNVIDGLFRQCLDAKLSFYRYVFVSLTVQSAVCDVVATESNPLLIEAECQYYHLRELVIK